MARYLITGASGLIGRALAASLAVDHEITCLSRRDPGLDLPWVRGEFASFEDLRQLDGTRFDSVIHLGAVTGGCLERDGMRVNVEGTRVLMRYLIDRGCPKFVLASSIAVVGLQDPGFRPRSLPIADEHPCLDRHGYGFSKYLMEEVTRYYCRQNESIDVINLRLASIAPDGKMPPPAGTRPAGPWALGAITIMALSDAVRAFRAAAEAPGAPGLRILNATGPRAWVRDPIAAVLRNWWGDSVDLSCLERPGHEFDSVFDVTGIREELGFEAMVLP